VLEVGIGIGGTADHWRARSAASWSASTSGWRRRRVFSLRANPFLHIVQSSIFAPPFAEGTFDFVYSFGVIHHTYSTRRHSISSAGCRGPVAVSTSGSTAVDESRTLKRRLLMGLESMTRPWIARLPIAPRRSPPLPVRALYMAHQVLRKLRPGSTRSCTGRPRRCTRRATALRRATSTGTPKKEVAAWFSSAGYDSWCRLAARLSPWIPPGFSACTGIEGVRRS